MKRFSAKLRLHPRYARYQKLFFFFLVLFFASLTVEWVWFGSGGKAVRGAETGLFSFLAPLFFGEGLLILLTFFLGVTVYAPFCSALFSLARGWMAGFLLAVHFPLTEVKDVFLFLLSACYLGGSAWIFSGYSGFCSCVALRLFTDGGVRPPRREEDRLFGGTLFHSSLFCNTVNLRFFFSYACMLFAVLAVLFLWLFLYSFFRSLIY